MSNNQYIYRVHIIKQDNGKTFDNYLIKVLPSELLEIEKHIHERYPSSRLYVKFILKL